MKQLAWATDLHLDRLIERDYLEYKDYLTELNPESLIISGDIADGDKSIQFLKDFDDSFDFPIYFVLGNHDFYFNSFAGMGKKIGELVKNSQHLNWLSEKGIVKLNETTALIGVEGWGDAGNGTLNLSEGASRDVMVIEDYQGLNRTEINGLLNSVGERYARNLQPVLQEAVNNFQNIIFVTHVPPFVEVCFDRSLRICDEFKLPFYTCKAIGDMLLETMSANTLCRITVLCGHTHEKADAQILENLRVRVKESGYGNWWDATLINVE